MCTPQHFGTCLRAPIYIWQQCSVSNFNKLAYTLLHIPIRYNITMTIANYVLLEYFNKVDHGFLQVSIHLLYYSSIAEHFGSTIVQLLKMLFVCGTIYVWHFYFRSLCSASCRPILPIHSTGCESSWLPTEVSYLLVLLAFINFIYKPNVQTSAHFK